MHFAYIQNLFSLSVVPRGVLADEAESSSVESSLCDSNVDSIIQAWTTDSSSTSSRTNSAGATSPVDLESNGDNSIQALTTDSSTASSRITSSDCATSSVHLDQSIGLPLKDHLGNTILSTRMN